jgi:hypothetical protein
MVTSGSVRSPSAADSAVVTPRHAGGVTHWVIYDDGSAMPCEADHFAFETAHLKLTRWTMVLLRPREVVVRRLPLRGLRPICGVLVDC